MKLPYVNYKLSIGKKRVSYMPKGKISINPVYAQKNPIAKDYMEYGPSTVARMFVGLSDAKGGSYTMENLITLTRVFLRKVNFPQDSSFLSQKGVYTYKKGDLEGMTVQEESAIIVIIKTDSDISVKDFEDMTVKLAEFLCREMNQESIVIDLQESGVSQHIYEVVP